MWIPVTLAMLLGAGPQPADLGHRTTGEPIGPSIVAPPAQNAVPPPGRGPTRDVRGQGDGGGGDDGQGGGGYEDDDEREEEENERSTRPLFTQMGATDPPQIQERYPDWGVEVLLLMSQWAFDPDGVGRWVRPDRTDYWLETECPLDYDGFLVIDWEHGIVEVLKEGVDHPEFDLVVAELVRLAVYIKQKRPQARIGYWGLPLSKTWDQDEAWRTASHALRPVFDVCDALYPEVYDHFREDDPFHNDSRRVEQLEEVVRFTLELAGDDPVIIQTWHRYHTWTAGYGFELIPPSEYLRHVRRLLAVQYEGRHPHGAAAFGATRFYHERAFERDENGDWVRNTLAWANVRRQLEAEMRPGETIDEYVLRLHPRVYFRFAQAGTR